MQKRTDFFDNSLSRIVPDIPLVIRNKPHNNQLCADLSRLISAYPVVSHFLRFAWQTTIKLGDNGGMRFASKTGYINEYKVTLDDVKARDIIYAVEVPLNAEVGSMNIRKSISIVVTENE